MTVATAAPIALSTLAEWAGGELRLPPGAAGDRDVRGASIDTRTLEPGELFVPLAGAHTDGHDFIAAAFARGAAASLCARAAMAQFAGHEPGPLVVVDDVTLALQRIAQRHRQQWGGLVIGVTGSAGKTTTKDLVALALATDRGTLATPGNLNNHWGVPLTLLRLGDEHRAAVVEMGMSQPGEIAALAGIARPDAAVITLVGSAHLEAFGTVEAIATEKTALARALPAGAPVFAGADSPPLRAALHGARQRVITYGLAADANVRPRALEPREGGGWRLEVDGFPPCTLALIGRHQAVNALAAYAVAREYRLDPARVVRALESYAPGKGPDGSPTRARRDAHRRLLQLEPGGGARGARHARVVARCAAAHRAARRHARARAEFGAAARMDGRGRARRRAVGAGRARRRARAGARKSGATVRQLADVAEARAALEPILAPGVVVLLKASRGVALERVLDGLEAER
jgi:UDP-N-acetylmuramoyl-tripeptide--D-alanyl-D-alanine ligase